MDNWQQQQQQQQLNASLSRLTLGKRVGRSNDDSTFDASGRSAENGEFIEIKGTGSFGSGVNWVSKKQRPYADFHRKKLCILDENVEDLMDFDSNENIDKREEAYTTDAGYSGDAGKSDGHSVRKFRVVPLFRRRTSDSIESRILKGTYIAPDQNQMQLIVHPEKAVVQTLSISRNARAMNKVSKRELRQEEDVKGRADKKEYNSQQSAIDSINKQTTSKQQQSPSAMITT